MLLGVVNLGTGTYRSIDESVPGIHNWVYASCAMPLFFDPLKTRASDGTEEQWVDGGVRDVTPLSAALDMNPRGVIAVRASPAPRPGAVRTFPNLIKIGLRAVDILQSEVSANDLAGAALINDLIAAREAQLRALQSEGIGGAKAARILRPLDIQISHYRFAPIRIIEPEEEVAETLEFSPAKNPRGHRRWPARGRPRMGCAGTAAELKAPRGGRVGLPIGARRASSRIRRVGAVLPTPESIIPLVDDIQ